jgi:hypothetical protein
LLYYFTQLHIVVVGKTPEVPRGWRFIYYSPFFIFLYFYIFIFLYFYYSLFFIFLYFYILHSSNNHCFFLRPLFSYWKRIKGVHNWLVKTAATTTYSKPILYYNLQCKKIYIFSRRGNLRNFFYSSLRNFKIYPHWLTLCFGLLYALPVL